MPLLYHAYVYLEFLILACTIYILAPAMDLDDAIKDIDKFLKWIKEYNKKMNK